MKTRVLPLIAAGLLASLLSDWGAAAPAPPAGRPKEIASFQAHRTSVLSLAFSPDGKILATGSYDERVKLWDVASQKNVADIRAHLSKRGQIGQVARVAFSPNGKTIASCGEDRTVKLWDAATGRLVDSFDTAPHPPPLVFSPDGKILICGNDLYDLETKTLRKVMEKLQGNWPIAAFSPKGELRFSTYFRFPEPATFSLWEVATGRKTITCTAKFKYFRYLSFSCDGAAMVSIDGDHLIRLWDTATGENTANFDPLDPPGHPVWSPDGKVLAFALRSRATGIVSLRLLEVPSGERLATLKCDLVPTCLPAFSPDGRLLAAGGSGGVIKIWSLPKRYAIDKGSETKKDK